MDLSDPSVGNYFCMCVHNTVDCCVLSSPLAFICQVVKRGSTLREFNHCSVTYVLQVSKYPSPLHLILYCPLTLNKNG